MCLLCGGKLLPILPDLLLQQRQRYILLLFQNPCLQRLNSEHVLVASFPAYLWRSGVQTLCDFELLCWFCLQTFNSANGVRFGLLRGPRDKLHRGIKEETAATRLHVHLDLLHVLCDSRKQFGSRKERSGVSWTASLVCKSTLNIACENDVRIAFSFLREVKRRRKGYGLCLAKQLADSGRCVQGRRICARWLLRYLKDGWNPIDKRDGVLLPNEQFAVKLSSLQKGSMITASMKAQKRF
mmetsp:Transcript_18409/g.69659  ORF Transcript_18409/g.69659 Transcript_18409/m.69659 type:complete len:240 (-) Transcript_18409:1062-1781(-)